MKSIFLQNNTQDNIIRMVSTHQHIYPFLCFSDYLSDALRGEKSSEESEREEKEKEDERTGRARKAEGRGGFKNGWVFTIRT